MRDAVWIVGAGPLQVPLLEEAHALGLAVVMSDRNPEAPGAAQADLFLPLDTMDPEAHRLAAHRGVEGLHLRGCCTAGADCAPAVAAVAEALGTPGIPYPIAQLTHNKFDVRCALDGAGLAADQPGYRLVDWQVPTPREARGDSAVGMAERLEEAQRWSAAGQTLVVKPLEQSASRGVSIVPPEGRGRWEAAFLRAALAAPQDSRVLIEEALTGSEHSAEMIRDGHRRILFWNVVDRPFRYDDGVPFELGHVNPSRLSAAQLDATLDLLVRAADALAVTWGPFKCDLLWTATGPKILECTARLSGGWDCQATTPLSSGRSPMRAVLRLACGYPMDRQELTWQHWRYAACAAILPRPGRLVAWDPEAIVEGRPVLAERIILNVRRGECIAPYTHCATRPGFAICVRDTWEGAWEAAQHAARRIAEAMQTTEEEPHAE
jgi:biotin carboxylase